MSDGNQNTVVKYDSKTTNLGTVSDVLFGDGSKPYDLGNVRMAAFAYLLAGLAAGSYVGRKRQLEGKQPMGGLFF